MLHNPVKFRFDQNDTFVPDHTDILAGGGGLLLLKMSKNGRAQARLFRDRRLDERFDLRLDRGGIPEYVRFHGVCFPFLV